MASLSTRDAEILRFLADFKLLRRPQLHELVFAANTSRTPLTRALNRLQALGFIKLLAWQLNRYNCYYVTSRGWSLIHDAEYKRPTQYLHTLAIADTYIALVRLQRAGRLRILSYATEPYCWQVVGGQELRPDLYVEVQLGNGQVIKIDVEQDTGTQDKGVIVAKLNRYYKAFQSGELDEFPIVAFVTVDDARVRELRRWITTLPEEAHTLFRIMTLEGFSRAFG